MDERGKRVQLQGCVVLMGVAQDVGEDGLGVGQVFAQRNDDGLTRCCGLWGNRNLLSLDFQKHTSAR